MQPMHASQGMTVTREEPERLSAALDLAIDYRGDVTVDLVTGESIVGYLYDRKRAADVREQKVRLLPADGGSRMTVPVADIAKVSFSGRDTASGKSFETWMKKYVEKKLAGEQASIESESLER